MIKTTITTAKDLLCNTDVNVRIYNTTTNNNGDLYSALTKISTTRFTIAMYK